MSAPITPQEVAELAARATPGPWSKSGTAFGRRIVFAGTGTLLRKLCTVAYTLNEAEDNANANLIARAHDMAALIAEQAAEIERLRELTQWRPINDEAKKGNDVLLLLTFGRQVVASWDKDSTAPGYNWLTLDGPSYSDHAAAGWMPLTPPPAQEDAPCN